MSRDQQQKPQTTADVAAPIQRKQSDQGNFAQQSMNELGAKPVQRKADGPSARQQSLGEIGSVIQRREAGGSEQSGDVQESAKAGVAGPGEQMPHADKIQASFGKHDVSDVKAHTGGDAAAANDELGAHAYATGSSVAFKEKPDLHTAAHEAAHVVQQRAGKVAGGLGAADDAHERQADQVADAVVAGESAEPLLDQAAGDPAAATPASEVNAGAVQRKTPKDQESAFVPQFLTNDKSAHMILGETYPHKVWVTNADAAPKGTKYRWDHSVSGPSHRVQNKPDRPVLDGDSTYYPFELRGVGTYNVNSKLSYVSGKDQREAQTHMEVVVPKVTKHETEYVTEKDGKKRPFAGSMLVGEDLVITTSMPDLMRSHQGAPEAVRAHFMAPGLELKGTKTLANGVYEIRLHAKNEGGALGSVAALPYDTKLGDTPVHTIQTDIRKADDENNPDARPTDFAKAKEWLKSDYDFMFREMHTANQAFVMQSQVNDPPPKQSIWVDIVLGCATAALGGLAAGLSQAIAMRLFKEAGQEIAAQAIQEGVKTFMEQGLTAAAQATFSKDAAQNDYPHVAFFKFMESAINAKQRGFEQTTFSNVVTPKLDDAEKKTPGAGFSEAIKLDHALKAEAPNIGPKQFDASFEQWIKFVTKAQLGQTEKKDPKDPASETGTDMSGVNEENWKGKIPDTAGVIQIEVGGNNLFDPKTPVRLRKARMPGINQKLREKVANYKVKDLPFAVRVHGDAPGRYNGPYTFSRNEQGTYWLSRDDHEYLEKKSGGTAEDGARKILEQEIGDVVMTTPEG